MFKVLVSNMSVNKMLTFTQATSLSRHQSQEHDLIEFLVKVS